MRILGVSSMLLFPETRFGGAKRLYHLARELQKRADTRFLCFDACGEWEGFRKSSAPLPGQLPLPADLGRSPLRAWPRLPIDLEPDLRRLAPDIDAYMGGEGFDALWASFSLSLSFLGTSWAKRCRRVVYLEDDLPLEIYRKAAREGRNPVRRAWKWLRHAQTLAYYRSKLAAADALIAISPEEKTLMESYLPGVRVEILKHGLPPEEHPFLPPPEGPLTLGFIGNYRHGPNLDALQWLLDDVFPFLADRVPGLRLTAAGRFLPAALAERHRGNPVIRLLEDVPSLQEYYRKIGVFINPIVSGRGLRTKLVEAAAFGRPIISTALGAEGLLDLRIAIADGKEEMLSALQSLADPSTYRETAGHNRRVFEASYSAATLGESLHRILAGT